MTHPEREEKCCHICSPYAGEYLSCKECPCHSTKEEVQEHIHSEPPKTFRGKEYCPTCPEIQESTESDSWEEELKFGIMEDYLREAEMKQFLISPDDAEHYELMRGHYEKLKSFIRKHRTLALQEAVAIVRGMKQVPNPNKLHAPAFLERVVTQNQLLEDAAREIESRVNE